MFSTCAVAASDAPRGAWLKITRTRGTESGAPSSCPTPGSRSGGSLHAAPGAGAAEPLSLPPLGPGGHSPVRLLGTLSLSEQMVSSSSAGSSKVTGDSWPRVSGARPGAQWLSGVTVFVSFPPAALALSSR